jgi:hypothetical protein
MGAPAPAVGSPSQDAPGELADALYTVRERYLEEWVDVLDAVASADEADLQAALDAAAATRPDAPRRAQIRADLEAALAAPSSGGYRENVESLLAALERADRYWPGGDAANVRPNRTDRALEAFDEAFIEIGYVTVPARLHSKMQTQSVGAALDFYAEFADEFTNDEQIDVIFAWLAQHETKGYLLEPELGLVYRLPLTEVGKYLKIGTPVFMVVAGVGLLAFVRWLGLDIFKVPEADWPYADWDALAGTYAAVLLGALLHFIAKTGSGISFDDDLAVTVPRRSLDWISIRWVSVAWLFLPAYVTTLVVGATDLRTSDVEGVMTALLAGYSADSISGNFFGQIGKAADKTSKAIGSKPAPSVEPTDAKGDRPPERKVSTRRRRRR